MNFDQKKTPQNFGERLKEARKAKDLTIRQLGEETGINFTRIADFEAGRRSPGVEALKKLASVLEVEETNQQVFISYAREDSLINKLHKEYPLIPNAASARFLNEVSTALKGKASGNAVKEVYENSSCDLLWVTDEGEWVAVEIVVAVDTTREKAVAKIGKALEAKARRDS